MAKLYIEGEKQTFKLSYEEVERYEKISAEYPEKGIVRDTVIIAMPTIRTRSHDKYFLQYNYISGVVRLIIVFQDHQENDSVSGDITARCKYVKKSQEYRNLAKIGTFRKLLTDKINKLSEVYKLIEKAPEFKRTNNSCDDEQVGYGRKKKRSSRKRKTLKTRK